MSIDPALLAAEIDDDPLSLGYAARVAAGDDAGIVGLLVSRDYRGPVPIEVLSAYCINEGITGTIEAVANEPTGDPFPSLALKGLCRNVLSLVRDDFRLTTADVDTPKFAEGCDGLIAAGLISADQKAGMLALAEGRSTRAEVLWGYGATVSGNDVSFALRGAR